MRVRADWSAEALGLERKSKRVIRAMRPEQNPIERARLFQRVQAGPPHRTYREVAAELGVTVAEVCHYLTIVQKLPPDLVAAVEAEQDPRRIRIYSLRALRGIARLPNESRQRKAFTALSSKSLPYDDRVPPVA